MGTIATLTIANGANVSGSFNAPNDPSSYDTVKALIPAAWTAADLKLQFSNDDGSSWLDVTESDGGVSKLTSIPTTGGGLQFAPHDANSGLDYWAQALKAIPNGLFRIASIDTADETAENQGAERSVSLIAG